MLCSERSKGITLVFPDSQFLLDQAVFPPLGILYLASYLKLFGVDVQCLDLGLGHKLEDAKHDLIGISLTSPQALRGKEILDFYKKEGRTVIAGGPHATHMKDECLEWGFDHVIQGYGEEPLANLLIDAPIQGIPIDAIPYPDRTALPVKDYRYFIDGELATVVMTARGCPFNCAFCARISRAYSECSADYSINEIYLLHEEFGYKAFMLFDDTFVVNKKKLKQFADIFESSPFKFRCFGRSNLLTDEVCELLARMGVVEVGVGVESGSDKILKSTMKGTTSTMNYNAIQRLRKHGIRSKAFIIVGLPGEDVNTILDTWMWLDTCAPDDVDISLFQPMPGSPIYNDSKKYEVYFKKSSNAFWYKGVPGSYTTSVSTKDLSSRELIYWRDRMENSFKDPGKLR